MNELVEGTELGFLIELLLNHELPKDTKSLIASRVKVVEANLAPRTQAPMQVNWQQPPGPKQAASTLAAMARHGDIPAAPVSVQAAPPEPVAVIAQTPATAAAMNARNDMISASLDKKIDKATGRPKKFLSVDR